MSSCRKHQEISCSSLLFFIASKLWRTKCETRKWQLHEQVWALLCLHSSSPINSMLFLFYPPSQNGAFCAERHYCHSKSSYTLYSPPFQPFQASDPESSVIFQWEKEKTKIQEHKSSISDRKGLLLIDGRWRKHPSSYTNSRDRYTISPAHFDHFHT